MIPMYSIEIFDKKDFENGYYVEIMGASFDSFACEVVLYASFRAPSDLYNNLIEYVGGLGFNYIDGRPPKEIKEQIEEFILKNRGKAWEKVKGSGW